MSKLEEENDKKQLELLPIPLTIVWLDPNNLGTADSAGACRASDGLEYIIKCKTNSSSIPRSDLIPHSEWFCSRLGDLIHLPIPAYRTLAMPDGELVFGSRCEGGVMPETVNWWDKVEIGEIDYNKIKETICRIYVFDNFIFNSDRHLNNYLFREARSGWSLFSFDYSRAWLCMGLPLRSLPFAPVEKTLKVQRYIRRKFGEYIDQVIVDDVLNKLNYFTENDVNNIIESHPVEWLSENEKDGILSWWASPAKEARINGISEGIKDGTYL